MPISAGLLTFKDGGAAAGTPKSMKFAAGQFTTVSATDTIVTGLTTVYGCVAGFDADVSDANFLCQATIGDQSASPVAGSIILKTWKNTSGSDPTPVAASAFSQKCNWFAWGV